MGAAKIAITIDPGLLKKLDHFVRKHVFSNRSQAIQNAIMEKLDRMEHNRLAVECAKLDPAFEQKLADEALSDEDSEWPEY